MFDQKKWATLSALLIALLSTCFSLTSCSNATNPASPNNSIPTVETFPISADQLQNCHFQNQSPTYTYQAPIPPNPIVCDAGVPTKVELMSLTTLPSGLQFSANSLSLTGTANAKISQTPYQYYIENEAGYQVISLQITVK